MNSVPVYPLNSIRRYLRKKKVVWDGLELSEFQKKIAEEAKKLVK